MPTSIIHDRLGGTSTQRPPIAQLDLGEGLHTARAARRAAGCSKDRRLSRLHARWCARPESLAKADSGRRLKIPKGGRFAPGALAKRLCLSCTVGGRERHRQARGRTIRASSPRSRLRWLSRRRHGSAGCEPAAAMRRPDGGGHRLDGRPRGRPEGRAHVPLRSSSRKDRARRRA